MAPGGGELGKGVTGGGKSSGKGLRGRGRSGRRVRLGVRCGGRAEALRPGRSALSESQLPLPVTLCYHPTGTRHITAEARKGGGAQRSRTGCQPRAHPLGPDTADASLGSASRPMSDPGSLASPSLRGTRGSGMNPPLGGYSRPWLFCLARGSYATPHCLSRLSPQRQPPGHTVKFVAIITKFRCLGFPFFSLLFTC